MGPPSLYPNMRKLYYFFAIALLGFLPYQVLAAFVIPADDVVFDSRPAIFASWDLVSEEPAFSVDTRAEQLFIPQSDTVICALYVDSISENFIGTAPWTMRARIVQGSISALSQNSYTKGDAPPAPATSTVSFYWDPCLVLRASTTSTIRFERTAANLPSGQSMQLTVFMAATSTETELFMPAGSLGARNMNTGILYVTSTRPLGVLILGSSQTSYFDEPSNEAYGFTQGAASGTDFGLFGNMVRDVLMWLFVPSQNVWNGIDNYKSDLMTRVPFGWFSQVSSTFSGLDSDTTTSTVISWHASTSMVNETVTIFDPQEIEATIPENIRNFIKAIAGVALWTFLFVYIVNLATNRTGTNDDDV